MPSMIQNPQSSTSAAMPQQTETSRQSPSRPQTPKQATVEDIFEQPVRVATPHIEPRNIPLPTSRVATPALDPRNIALPASRCATPGIDPLHIPLPPSRPETPASLPEPQGPQGFQSRIKAVLTHLLETLSGAWSSSTAHVGRGVKSAKTTVENALYQVALWVMLPSLMKTISSLGTSIGKQIIAMGFAIAAFVEAMAESFKRGVHDGAAKMTKVFEQKAKESETATQSWSASAMAWLQEAPGKLESAFFKAFNRKSDRKAD